MKMKDFFAEFRLIWQFITPFWKSEQKIKAWSMLLIILVCNILIVYGYVEINKWNNKLYNAIGDKNFPALLQQLYIYIPIVFAMVATFNVNYYLTSILGFIWRKWLTDNFTKKWLYNNSFYRTMLLADHPDNPDQRISQDLAFFSKHSLDFFLIIFRESISLVSFTAILWNLSGTINLTNIIGLDINIHGYLLWIALLYSIGGTYIAIKIGAPLIALDFTQEKFEANFRYSLIRIREKREEIALYNDTAPEIKNLQDCFNDIKNNFYNIVIRTVYLDIWRNLYIHLDTVVPLIVAAPMYFAGIFTLGTLMQIKGAFESVKNSLSIIIKVFPTITAWLASSRRLLQLEQHLNNAKFYRKHSKIILTHTNGHNLICENLTLNTPDGQILLRNINLTVNSKDRVLITGHSGIGKSTFVRTIAGLWPYGQGNITLPSASMFFVPQKSYMPIATLREVIIYPSNTSPINDIELANYLKLMHLEHLINKLDQEQDWSLTLSIGEQQRISIIRVLIHKPQWIIMDEPTSSLDAELQQITFEILNSQLKNSTIITISHSHELAKYHNIQIDMSIFK
jgi:putative ATP-binding cassette transporter